jgi:hypothetical protein
VYCRWDRKDDHFPGPFCDPTGKPKTQKEYTMSYTQTEITTDRNDDNPSLDIGVLEIASPEEVAKQIMIRPGPGTKLYYNGLLDLDVVIKSVEPGLSEAPNEVLEYYRRAVRDKRAGKLRIMN